MNSAAFSAWESYVGQRFAELKSEFPDSISANDPRVIALKSARDSWNGLKVLDIGCGKGRYAEHFQSWGAEYVGIDLMADVQSSGRQHANLLVGSGLHLPFADKSFDVVSLVETIQHSPMAEVAIHNAISCVRPGGSIVVIERNPIVLSSDWPILPAILVKCIDQYRGRWMYPQGCGVKERWISAWKLKKQFKNDFHHHRTILIGSLEQHETCLQKLVPRFRPFYCYIAQKKED